MNCNPQISRIVPGSKLDGVIYLSSNRRPVSALLYTAGKLVFRNEAGTVTEIDLDMADAAAPQGACPFTMTAEDTADADGLWTNCDLVLTQGSDEIIIPISNRFEVVPRNVPGA